MKDQYQIKAPTEKVEVVIEKEVVQILKSMEAHTKIPVSELLNTAAKRFITAHSDFLPPKKK